MKNTFFKFFCASATLILLSLLMAGFAASFFQSMPLFFTVLAIWLFKSFSPTSKVTGALYDPNSLNIQKLTDVLGAYCQENRDILITDTLLDTEFDQKYTVLDGVTDEVPLPNLQMSNVVKPADPLNFTPTANAVNFDARILRTRACKVDITLVPQIMEKTWLGKMKKPNDVFDMPFEAYIMQEIVKHAKQEIRLQAIYKGIYYAAGVTAGDTMDGFENMVDIELARVGTTLAPVVTGAITSINILDKFLLVYDSLSDQYKGVPTVADVPPIYFDWYVRKFMPVLSPTMVINGGTSNMSFPVMTEVPLLGTNATLRREPGKSVNKPFVFTPKDNLFMGVDSDVFDMNIQLFNRTIKIMMDFKVGVNYAQFFGGSTALNVVAA